MSKILLILIIGVTAVALGAVAYIVYNQQAEPISPSVDEITPLTKGPGETLASDTTWFTYRNEKYGFELEYPEVYDEYEECRLLETGNGIELGGGRLRIEIIDSQGMISLEDYVNQSVDRYASYIEGLSDEEKAQRNVRVKVEKIFLAGREGFRVDLPGRPSSYLVLSKDDKIYKIAYGSRGVTGCLGYEHPAGVSIYDKYPDEKELYEHISDYFRLY